jgi:hypothetical protein
MLDLKNPAAGWKAMKPMPTPRGALASGVLRGRIVVFGGELNGQYTFSQTEGYDPATDTWVGQANGVKPMPTARHGMHGAVVNDVIYAPGGGLDWGTPDPSHDAYGPKWTKDPAFWAKAIQVNEAFGWFTK